MTTDTIFNAASETPAAQPSESAQTTEGMFAALVGETQKYKTPEDLAKAYANADSFIEQLKEENRLLREKAESAKTIDDVLERISTSKAREQEDTPVPTLNEETISALVEKTISGRETAKTRTNNLLEADRLMKEKFGEKAAEVFKAKATDSATAKVYMELASVSPQEFVKLFAGESPNSTQRVDTSSVNTATIPSSRSDRSGVEFSKEWVTKVRKEDPSRYYSSEFQYQLQRKIAENPNLYFNKES